MTNIVAQICEALDRADRILLLGHRDPDGDSAGSLLALAEALTDKTVYCFSDGTLPSRYGFLDPAGRMKSEIDLGFQADLAVTLECPAKIRLGAGQQMIPDGIPVINIDHHKDNQGYGDINWLDASAAALGEMLFDMFELWGKTISLQMATCLYTAILTDTGRFHYRGTSARTLRVCSELLKLGADPKDITERIYFGLPFAYLRLMQTALNRMERAADGRVLSLTLTPEDFAEAGAHAQDAEGIIDLTLMAEDTRIGMLFRQAREGYTKVSFRSQDSVDVGLLAAEFNGGGHANASGCVVAGTIEEVRRLITRRAVEYLNGSR